MQDYVLRIVHGARFLRGEGWGCREGRRRDEGEERSVRIHRLLGAFRHNPAQPFRYVRIFGRFVGDPKGRAAWLL